jgi:hypothetical protein
MSLTGNTFYGGQNLENTEPLDSINTNIENLQTDITQNTIDIAQNVTDISTNTSAIAQNVTDISTNTSAIAQNVTDISTNATDIATNTTDIATNATALTDITYDLTTDTTDIANRLTIQSNHSWGGGNLGKSAQLELKNTFTGSPYSTFMWSGAMYAVANQSKLVGNLVGSSVIMNAKSDGTINEAMAICLTGPFPSEKRGMIINLQENQVSGFYAKGGQFQYDMGDYDAPALGSVYYYNSEILLQCTIPGLEQPFMNVRDTLDNLVSGATTRAGQIASNDADILAIQGVNTTQNTNISDNASAITAIQGVNTTQDTNISDNASAITAIQGVNTTQDTDISAIQVKTNKLTVSGSTLDINNTASQLRLNQNLNINNKDITNTSKISLTGYSGLMQAYCSSSSMFNFESVLLGDTTNGSGFNFRSVKSGLTKDLSIDYNDVDFNTRTLTNCTNIDTMASTIVSQAALISTLQSEMLVVQQPLSAKCTIYISGGNYAMTGQNGFRTFPGSGDYVDKVSAGVISVLLDISYSTALDANFVATMNGYKDTPLVEAEQMIFCMYSPSAFYSGGVLLGYSFRIYGSRSYDQYNAFTDLGTNGKIHATVNF